MRATNLGDMAHNFMLQKRNVALRQDINRLTEELATGQVAETRQVLNGNYSYLTDLERSMDVLKGYKVATTEATHLTTGMQAALERVNGMSQDLSESLLFAATSSAGTSGTAEIANEAEQALNSMMGVINTRVAGRSLFSGVATDTAPLASKDDLLAGLRSAVLGTVNVDDMIAASKVWFDDPFGFSASIYQGSNQPLAPIALSDSEAVSLDVRGNDPGLRDSRHRAMLQEGASIRPCLLFHERPKTEPECGGDQHGDMRLEVRPDAWSVFQPQACKPGDDGRADEGQKKAEACASWKAWLARGRGCKQQRKD